MSMSPQIRDSERHRRRPITTESIGSAATHPSLRGALATKQSRGHNMRGASNPDGRTAAPGLLRFAHKKQSVILLILPTLRGVESDLAKPDLSYPRKRVSSGTRRGGAGWTDFTGEVGIALRIR